MTTYQVTMGSGYTWRFRANLAEASAPLQTVEEDEVGSTPYRTADARHDALQAAQLLWRLECGTGGVMDDDTIESVEDTDA